MAVNLRGQSISATKVPGEVSHWYRFSKIFLKGNKLAGALPDAVGSWTLLESLDVRDNKLAGALPGAVASWRSTRWIWLANNKLSGVVLDLEMHLLALFYDVISVNH